jgi:rhodanese-related sulfurtransferase
MSTGTESSVAGGSGGEAASPEQVRAWLAGGKAVLIDVREPDEHAREAIEGARLLPLSRFDAGKAWYNVSPNQRLVLHCRSGRRSADACRLAGRAIGGAAAINLAGGIEAWKAAGLPVKANAAVPGMSVMRQTQLAIGVMVVGGTALAWFVHPWFMVIPAFFGAGLVVAGLTGTCGLSVVLAKMPWNRAGQA